MRGDFKVMLTVREVAKQTNLAYKKFLDKGNTHVKNELLSSIAKKLEENVDFIIAENFKDLEYAKKTGMTEAFVDRLMLDEKRIKKMAISCREIIALKDPVGTVYDMNVRPDGLRVGKMRVPIGVIGIIYEARPNVTIEAATLCLKSGNGVILRGGSASFHSNIALVKLIKEALEENNVEPHLISYLETKERTAVDDLVTADDYVHLIIPRGGESLIRSVTEKSTIPVLKHYKGICHVYINKFADIQTACTITINAKVQRPGVCNAAEKLLIDKDIADEIIPLLIPMLQKERVEIKGCSRVLSIFSNGVASAAESDWDEEYLSLTLAVMVVDNIDHAIEHINKHGSGHTDAIVTKDISSANKFVKNIDSSSVMVNASTRLADGGVYGLGAEIGIATDRLHARGPMGVDDLTTYKWVVLGEGHLRT